MFEAEVDRNAQHDYWSKTGDRRPPDHPVIVAFAEPKVRFIKNCVDKDRGGRKIEKILDVGCGNGFFTLPLSKWANCTALDFSKRMLELNPVNVVKVCGDVLAMPFPDNSFDLVFCSNLLHHVTDPVAAVAEMKRVSSGYVVLSEPNRNNPMMFLFGLAKWAERGSLKFSCGYMRHLADKTGMKVVCLKSMGTVLPNKTPMSLLKAIKLFDGVFPLAFYNVMVCRKG